MKKEEISLLLDRGVADVLVRKDLEQWLNKGEKLRVKFGIDPTGFDLTLGHAIPLRKLRQFQDAGHQVVLLFGTFTAQIGDPTGKSQTREPLTKKQVLDNAQTYLEQASKVLDIDNIEVVYNGDWLENMSFKDLLPVAGNFTVAQMLERDMFQERIKEKKEINLVEFLYPLMQGYDSVPIKANVEIGGTDQLFNMMCARPIQKSVGQRPQSVLTVPILVGTDGHEKMSKSLGNYIALNDNANEIFGKIMSLPDSAMASYFELLTEIPESEYTGWINENPRDGKVKLATIIIQWLHDATSAEKAEQDFVKKFVKKEVPEEMPTFAISEDDIGLLNLLSQETNFAGSNGEARRLVQEGGVSIDGKKITDPTTQVFIGDEAMILKVGKRKFGRIVKM